MEPVVAALARREGVPCEGATMSGASASPWAVVLAGGEGRRLADLTRRLYGDPVPKQFARLGGPRSLLQETLHRTAGVIPATRTLVVVTEEHAGTALDQLAPYRGVELVAQPRNLDTGPGVLLPLVRILARDPEAPVVFLPSDHDVPRREPFLESVRTAIASVEADPDRITLVGAVAGEPETEYGWIVPGRRPDPERFPTMREVRAFVEKPTARLAERLLREGALWNTFVFAARAVSLWARMEVCLPEHAPTFATYASRIGERDERSFLRDRYDRMRPANFSREVLEKVSGLGVVPVAGSGWSDLGTPARVFRSLRGSPQGRRLSDPPPPREKIA